MILTRVKDSKGGHFADYKKLRAYMRQETYWQGMFEEGTIMIAKFEIEGPQLPQSFEAFFKTSRKTHVSQAYTHVLGSIKSASDYVSLPEIVSASKRLVYRYALTFREPIYFGCSTIYCSNEALVYVDGFWNVYD